MAAVLPSKILFNGGMNLRYLLGPTNDKLSAGPTEPSLRKNGGVTQWGFRAKMGTIIGMQKVRGPKGFLCVGRSVAQNKTNVGIMKKR